MLLAAPRPSAAAFVADLSDHLIAITTGFAGTEVLLFGAVQEPGSEIVVVIRGPVRDAVVRRKSRVGPIWINTSAMGFRAVPSFYAVAASAPLAELGASDVLARHELGVENLRLEPLDAAAYDAETIAAFRAALIRNKQRAGLFPEAVGTVSFLGGTLFRTRLYFPANVPPGLYQVQVLELMDGYVTGAQASALEISKIGLEADLYDFANQQPALYGLVTILLALFAGWSGNALFRKA